MSMQPYEGFRAELSIKCSPVSELQAAVIVTAYNNSTTIMECLATLERQTYQPRQILVVCDQASTDSTLSQVEEFVQGREGITLLKCNGLGRSAARNLGWTAISSSVVMFADGDDLYTPEYLEKAISSLVSNPKAAGVCVGGAPLAGRNATLNVFYSTYGPTDSRINPAVGRVPDWAWVYLRSSLERVGGFDEKLSQAEDKDLCRRIKDGGYEIAYVPGVNWFHRKPETLVELLRKEYNAGKRRVFYLAKNREYSAISLKLAPLTCLVALSSLVPLGAIWGVGILLLAFLSYVLVAASRLRKKAGSLRRATFVEALSVASSISVSVGAAHGMIAMGLRRARLTRLEPGRF